MSGVDLRKLALRWKVLEMLRLLSERRKLAEAARFWRRLVRPN
ncbi:MAG: hypothetical protein OXG13_03600 [Gemmatimonadaceae bacterium]|nr:hypothetical protein [Gemmatimonadaceae bacterium]